MYSILIKGGVLVLGGGRSFVCYGSVLIKGDDLHSEIHVAFYTAPRSWWPSIVIKVVSSFRGEFCTLLYVHVARAIRSKEVLVVCVP